MTDKKKFIAVIGGGKFSAKEAELAEEVGRKIARQGAILICSGLSGVVVAVCKGALSEGEVTIGILPEDSRKQANRI